MDTKHIVYVIECSNGSYYTGYTTDLERRYREHQQGTKKCRYTRSFPPKRLVAHWSFQTKSEAMQYEYLFKKLTRKNKENILNEMP